MEQLIKGTTPTIRYSFSTVTVSNIVVALLKVTQKGVQIQKNLTDAEVQAKALEWVLTQEDTLALKDNQYAMITLDWLLADGTRGAGNTAIIKVVPSGTNEVLEVPADEQ